MSSWITVHTTCLFFFSYARPSPLGAIPCLCISAFAQCKIIPWPLILVKFTSVEFQWQCMDGNAWNAIGFYKCASQNPCLMLATRKHQFWWIWPILYPLCHFAGQTATRVCYAEHKTRLVLEWPWCGYYIWLHGIPLCLPYLPDKSFTMICKSFAQEENFSVKWGFEQIQLNEESSNVQSALNKCKYPMHLS